jgi:hypothetical protein
MRVKCRASHWKHPVMSKAAGQSQPSSCRWHNVSPKTALIVLRQLTVAFTGRRKAQHVGELDEWQAAAAVVPSAADACTLSYCLTRLLCCASQLHHPTHVMSSAGMACAWCTDFMQLQPSSWLPANMRISSTAPLHRLATAFINSHEDIYASAIKSMTMP